jgi:hypothetical protein
MVWTPRGRGQSYGDNVSRCVARRSALAYYAPRFFVSVRTADADRPMYAADQRPRVPHVLPRVTPNGDSATWGRRVLFTSPPSHSAAAMPRIRSIKPEMFQDEKLARQDPLTRLVFIGLIAMADDAGRLPDVPRLIDGFIFPWTLQSSLESIETLMRLKMVLRYSTESGRGLLQIVNWSRHQYVANPSKHVLPPPSDTDWQRFAVAELTESNGDPNESLMRSTAGPNESLSRSSCWEVGSRKKEIGSRMGDVTTLVEVPQNGRGTVDPVAGGNGVVTTNGKQRKGIPAVRVQERIATYFTDVATATRTKKATRAAQVDVAFAYWCAVHGKDPDRTLLDRKRELLILARLEESNGDLSILLYAIQGAKKDRALIEGGYDRIETILRDRGNVERLAEHMPKYRRGEMHPMAKKLLGIEPDGSFITAEPPLLPAADEGA